MGRRLIGATGLLIMARSLRALYKNADRLTKVELSLRSRIFMRSRGAVGMFAKSLSKRHLGIILRAANARLRAAATARRDVRQIAIRQVLGDLSLTRQRASGR